MHSGQLVFAQLMDFLPRHEFNTCVRRYHGHRRQRGFSCRDQFLCLAFAQLTFRESLRDIQTCLHALGPKLYHAGFRGQVSRSTLADANRVHDWRIAFLLDEYARVHGGEAFADGIGFAMRPPLSSGRESFSPDAWYYVGPLPKNKMRFVEGAPIFAVEVRSEDDYGPAAEIEMAAKRADYFEAGTKVVWDVDPEAGTITSYVAGAAERPLRFAGGDQAHAEPALSHWQVTVDDLLGPVTK